MNYSASSIATRQKSERIIRCCESFYPTIFVYDASIPVRHIKRPSTIFSTLCVVFSVTLNLIGAFGGSSEVGLLSSSLNGASPFSLGALLRKPAIVAQHVQPDG